MSEHPTAIAEYILDELRATALLSAGLSTLEDRGEELAVAFQLKDLTGSAHAHVAEWEAPKGLQDAQATICARLAHLHALAVFQASDDLEQGDCYGISFEQAARQLEEAARTTYRWAVASDLFGTFESGGAVEA